MAIGISDITENDVDSQKRERMPKEFEYLDDSLRRKKKNAINDGYNDLQARYDQVCCMLYLTCGICLE